MSQKSFDLHLELAKIRTFLNILRLYIEKRNTRKKSATSCSNYQLCLASRHIKLNLFTYTQLRTFYRQTNDIVRVLCFLKLFTHAHARQKFCEHSLTNPKLQYCNLRDSRKYRNRYPFKNMSQSACQILFQPALIKLDRSPAQCQRI